MNRATGSSGVARGGMRTPSAERRRQVLDHAVGEFARRGLKGATTLAIAAGCGISQPYLFRLFDSKATLFLATLDHGFDLAEAETSNPAAAEDGVSSCCSRFAESREAELARLFLQGCAAAYDDEQVADLLRRLANRCERPDNDLLTELLHTAGGIALREVNRQPEDNAS